VKLTFKSFITTINYEKPIYVLDKKILKNEILDYQIYNEQNQLFANGYLQFIPHLHHSNLLDLNNFLVHFFKTYDLSFDRINLCSPTFNIIKNFDTPNVEFLYAIESIIFNILFHHFKNALPSIENPKIKVNALASLDQLPNQINASCLKIKIQPNFSIESLKKLDSILKLNENLTIRLDGNQQFSANQLLEFLSKFENISNQNRISRIEYIEEALQSPLDYDEIFKKYAIFQAIDESLEKLDSLQNIHNISAFILKPSVLSISKCFNLIKNQKNNVSKFVISSTYEPAQSLLEHLYLTQLSPSTYHGLGTLDFLPKKYTNMPSDFFLEF
jgi:hypothetical protein